MRKLFSLLAIVMAMALFSSCSSDSPSGVAEKAMKCIKAKDYKGYADLLLFNDADDAEKLQREKDGAAAMLGEKMDETMKEKDGIKDYKVVSEEVKDSVATVKMEIVFGNGDTKDNSFKMKKDKNGDWKIDGGK